MPTAAAAGAVAMALTCPAGTVIVTGDFKIDYTPIDGEVTDLNTLAAWGSRGVLAMLGIQTFMIVAGVIKMIPLTGVTMPFLSYGGSSLLSCMAMIGILHGASARAQENLEEDILCVKG